MRRAVFALMMTLLFLGGCRGEQDEEVYERWRQSLIGAKIFFDAEISVLAEAEQTVYAVHVRHDAAETELTLTAPANLAGISLRCRSGEAELCYDGLILSIGRLGAAGDDPCSAVPRMMEALASSRLMRTWREGEYLAAELPLGEERTIRLWLERETMTPFRMEATENGQCVVFCNIKNWTMGDT